MTFPKYEAYKDSEVEWLGEVPEHWTCVPIKYVAVLNPKKSDYQGDPSQNCSFLPMEKLKTGVLLLNEERTVSDVYAGYTYFENGDVLQAKVTPCFENKNIAIAENLTNGIGFGSSEINVLRASEDISNRFLYYRLQENNFMGFCVSSMTGVAGLQRVPSDTINNFSIAIPGKSEQTQIARFLDHETALVDALIAEQERLIELLKEKRQAVISHAVTKGLDSTVPMKNSGVDWLDEVPAHWKVGSLGYYSTIDTGATPDRSKPEYWNGDVPWIKTGEVNYKTIFQAEEHISIEGVNNSATRIAPKGTLLMAMYGQGVTRGRVAILGIDAAYNQACAGVSVEPDLKVEFLRDYFTAAYPYIRDDGNETSQMNLSSGYIAKIKVTVPPIQEQVAISNFIEQETEKLNSLISEASSVSGLLQERRSALISAAVTGKIDVRGWQPPASDAPAATLEAACG